MSEAEYLELIEQLEQTIWDCAINLNLAGNVLKQHGMSSAGDAIHATAIRALDAIGEDVVNLPDVMKNAQVTA